MIIVHTGDGQQIQIDGDHFVVHTDGTVRIQKNHRDANVAVFNLGAIIGLEVSREHNEA